LAIPSVSPREDKLVPLVHADAKVIAAIKGADRSVTAHTSIVDAYVLEADGQERRMTGRCIAAIGHQPTQLAARIGTTAQHGALHCADH
jgi:hypothetical protein